MLIFATLAFVAFQTLSGLFTIGTVVLFFFAFQRGYSVLNDLFRSMASLLEDTIFMNDFRHFLEGERVEESTAAPEAMPETRSSAGTFNRPAFTLDHSIRVANLSFRYEHSGRDALRGVNLTIRKGETVAIVGANGSGKTTLIKLLCGFYMPGSGKIYYDSATTEELGREQICNHLSAVFQDFALYNVTANENIALGAIRQAFSEQKAKHAAGMAGIAEVLEQLPEGYNTLLGNQFLGGEELSIGQWQKLAIARAFYRDRELLLMDEPSSALDAVSEQQIIETLQKLAHQKTAVIISHRLSTVRWADRIVVFDEGCVVEEGTHDQLMQQNGTYAHLYRQATRSYAD
jgi:ATP-binding cassette subfamily B protein